MSSVRLVVDVQMSYLGLQFNAFCKLISAKIPTTLNAIPLNSTPPAIKRAIVRSTIVLAVVAVVVVDVVGFSSPVIYQRA